jgi:hypothetical protein
MREKRAKGSVIQVIEETSQLVTQVTLQIANLTTEQKEPPEGVLKYLLLNLQLFIPIWPRYPDPRNFHRKVFTY